jgi:hypothetical protein
MSAYWVTSDDVENEKAFQIPTDVDVSRMAQGTLAELQQRLAEGWPSILPSPSVTTGQAVKRLPPRMLGNVAALYGLTAGLTDGQWPTHPNPDEW